MSEASKKAPAKPVATAAKPPKKLVPRTAPKQPQAVPAPVAVAASAEIVAAAVKPVRKPTQVEATVARHQKVLAEALVKAQAINYDQPKVVKSATRKVAKVAKPPKAKKIRLVRDSYAMPDTEYERIGGLKKRLSGLGREVKKSELLRAGIAVLDALNDAELQAVIARVERIKTGRPKK